ncbi:MAG: TetR/AcrR family transcriptional regulator [Candidatus Thioglobus sp.]|uniref:TetR/AcrR family transcriptional regulator n=1 Tax=Candidatus Thioglobus sp. TaxID=2026721 RepID=UPI00262817CC|nr:TetR/AcrR family transcriptional regulator [Candidatus Thioglobus sp.]MDC9727207.1 TetR/AcrR family transcriptional regulator [Candidatus Thioglobus sp.]
MFFYTKNTKKQCTFNTADKINEAALTLFAEHGFFNTSIHHIQKKSQVSIGSIYHHFGSKEAIADSLQKKILEQMEESFIDVINQYDTFQEKYYHIIELLFLMTESEPRAMQFIFHSKYSEYSKLSKSIYQSKPFSAIHKEVKIHCKNSIIDQKIHSVDLTMALLFGFAIQLIQLRLDKVMVKPITLEIDTVFNAVWNGVCSEKQAI